MLVADLTSDVRAAIQAALAELDGLPPREAVEEAGLLSEYLADEAAAVAKLRAVAAAHLRTSEQLSLSGLAEALGVSKARAAQLVRTATTGK